MMNKRVGDPFFGNNGVKRAKPEDDNPIKMRILVNSKVNIVTSIFFMKHTFSSIAFVNYNIM